MLNSNGGGGGIEEEDTDCEGRQAGKMSCRQSSDQPHNLSQCLPTVCVCVCGEANSVESHCSFPFMPLLPVPSASHL